MLKLRAEEKDLPIKSKWFKHKEKEIYKIRIGILEFTDYNEVV